MITISREGVYDQFDDIFSHPYEVACKRWRCYNKGWIEAERLKTQKEREEKEQAILAQKLGGLDMSHRRR